jgi:hypothetical protein
VIADEVDPAGSVRPYAAAAHVPSPIAESFARPRG